MTCVNCLTGHFGPGVYLMLTGITLFLEACGAKFLRYDVRVLIIFWCSITFAPCATAYELMESYHNDSMENLHHLILYLLVLVEALLILVCDLSKLLPVSMKQAYEALLFPIAGFLFFSHANGSILYRGFHQVMFPGLVLSGLIHYLCETNARKTSLVTDTSDFQTLRLIRGLWISILGSWFFQIGVQFFLLTDTSDSSRDEMVWGMLSFHFSAHFVIWTILYTLVYCFLVGLGLCDSSFSVPAGTRFNYKALSQSLKDDETDFHEQENLHLSGAP